MAGYTVTMMEKEEPLPNRIRELRTGLGLTQPELADMTSTTKQQIGRLETGKVDLTLTWARRLARAFDCRPGDLLLLEDQPEPLIDEVLFSEVYVSAANWLILHADFLKTRGADIAPERMAKVIRHIYNKMATAQARPAPEVVNVATADLLDGLVETL